MDLVIILAVTFSILLYKSVYIRLHLVIFLYPIWIMYLAKNGVSIPGIISSKGLIFYENYLSDAFWWALIGIICLMTVLWSKRNDIISYSILNIEEKSRILLVLFTVVCGAIFLPGVFFLSNARFNLIPVFAWGALYNVLSVILILSHRKFNRWSSVLHLMLLLFIILRGERADQIMVLLALFLFQGDMIKKEIHMSLKIIIISISGALIISIIGIVRIIGFESFFDNFSYWIGLTFYAQQTAADVTHVYLSSVYYFFTQSPNFSILLNLPLSIIPGTPGGGTNADTNYIIALMDVVPSYGGGLFYAEAAMNFGLIGVIIYTTTLGLVMRYAISCNSTLKKVITFVFLILIFRLHWYGLLYIIKPIYMSILLIIYLYMQSKILKRRKINCV